MKKFSLLLMLLFSVNIKAFSGYKDSSVIPDKPGAKFVLPLIEVINSQDESKMREFIKENFEPQFLADYPMSMHLDFLQSATVESNELSFHSIRSYEEPQPANEIVAILRNNRTEVWQGLVINVTNSKPYKISSLDLTGARPPSDLPKPPRLTIQQAVAELDQYIQRMTEKRVFSGSVLLAKGDNILYKSATGLASKRFNIKNKVNTKFNLGSMNKMFTGVAIMQLVAQEKLTLKSKLSEFIDKTWLPEVDTSKIEIQHLLTHSSGLGSYFNRTYSESSKNNFRSLADYKPLLRAEHLQFEPGAGNSYSNTGMLLLGVVIEKVSGEDYFNYIREHIYKPAGMINSDSFEMDQPVANLAIGYEKASNQTGWVNNLYTHVLKGGPAGGGFSTVEDLHSFALALTQFKLIDKQYTEQLYSAKPELKSPFYGYGFGVFQTPDDTIVGHNGGFAGISANLDIYLKQGFIATVLSNHGNGSRPIEAKIRSLINRLK